MNFDQMLPSNTSVNALGQQWMTSMIQVAEIATATQQKLAGQQIAAMEANVAAMTKVAGVMSKEGQPADVYTAQVEAAKTLGEELMSVAREAWETQSETNEKIAAVWSKPADKPAKAK